MPKLFCVLVLHYEDGVLENCFNLQECFESRLVLVDWLNLHHQIEDDFWTNDEYMVDESGHIICGEIYKISEIELVRGGESAGDESRELNWVDLEQANISSLQLPEIDPYPSEKIDDSI